MINLNFGDAFTHIFKERRWWLKFGIITAINYAVIAITLLSTTFSQPSYRYTMSLKELTSLDFTTTLLIAASSFVASIIFLVLSTWYTYENTQAAIQKRQTRLIWEDSFGTTIKKVVKYLLAGFVYSIVIGALLLILIGIPLVILSIIIIASFTSTSTVMQDSTNAGTGMIVLFLAIMFCCVVVFAVMVGAVLIYLFTTPAYLRLVATNSFSEAFKFESNFRIAKKYFWYFIVILGSMLLYTFAFAALSSIFDVILNFIGITRPVVSLGLNLLVQLPLTIVSTYFTFYVYTRLLGNLYRGIIEKEDELKFLRK